MWQDFSRKKETTTHKKVWENSVKVIFFAVRAVYITFAFLLTSFADCKKLISGLGLNQSEVVEGSNISNEIEASQVLLLLFLLLPVKLKAVRKEVCAVSSFILTTQCFESISATYE
jgi:hypothetical protein